MPQLQPRPKNPEPDFSTWEAWRDVHQPFELAWWKEALAQGHSQDDQAFKVKWDEVKDFIQPRGVVIDIGSGPRPPFIPSIVIEPLANEYQKITPTTWWERITVYNQPAEVIVPDIRGDTIICWNCIDHAIGWRSILDNMNAYANPAARIAVATDFHPAFVGHPGFDRSDFMREIEARFEIIDRREPFGRALALVMKVK